MPQSDLIFYLHLNPRYWRLEWEHTLDYMWKLALGPFTVLWVSGE